MTFQTDKSYLWECELRLFPSRHRPPDPFSESGGDARFSGHYPPASGSKAYMHHPVEWYRFNTTLLQYDLSTKAWSDLGEYEQLARAGERERLSKMAG